MVLVSGSTGMLGTHLLKRLCCFDDYTVRALYRSEDKKEKTLFILNTLVPEHFKHNISRIQWVKADILDLFELDSAFKGITYVYHCAAMIGDSVNDYAMMRKVNIRGTANMVNFALDHNVIKFCHVSSIAALGRYPNGRLVDEEAVRDTDYDRSLYSITKYGAEMEVWRASQEGLDTLIVNPGVVLGAGFFESGSGQIFLKVLNNFKFYPPKKTGFVFVDDVVQAMLNGMHKDIVNQRYIVIGQNLSFKNVMSLIAEVFDRKKPTVKANKLMLYAVWAVQSLVSLFIPLKTRITRNMISTIFTQSQYDNSKSIQDLQIDYTSIEQTIVEIHKDYKLLNQHT